MRRTKAQQTTNSHETYRSLFSTDRERPAAAPPLSPSLTASTLAADGVLSLLMAVSAGVLESAVVLGSAGVLELARLAMSSKASV